MKSVQEARSVVAEAEKALRELMQRAIQDQRYSEISEVARLAAGLARLLRGEFHERAHAHGPVPRRSQQKAVRRGSSVRRNYPRFERVGDKLVKIGWSKKTRQEYEHRASFMVVDRVISAIRERFTDGEFFSATDILPLPLDDGDTVPDYQSYLVLKWLHMQGIVSKHGRDRYSIELGKLSGGTLESLWKQLPAVSAARDGHGGTP